MARDEVFGNTTARGVDFQFNEEIVNVFDDMLVRSVPFYLEQQSLIEEIAQRFALPDSLRMDENFALFRRNGFSSVETFFQWYNFAGFLCVKHPTPGTSDSKNSTSAQSPFF
ncbi:MAG: hypothetical protein IIB78_08025 [Proteobacteria bacterium]|nr:hypothetical protein [Pseudomonadota bacterium]